MLKSDVTCQHVIESVSQRFDQDYDACPAFFTGTLRDACHAAFSSTRIEDRRPVLIYIHNQTSLFSHIFCKNMFCSTTIIDYLLDSYIVWPWDITLPFNRDLLMDIWKDLFSEDFPMEECPLLIGIMRLFDDKNDPKYQFKFLLKCEVITRTNEIINRESLLNELRIFKTECDANEEIISFGFVRTIGLHWELILEIIKYLSLNDAITAFSPVLIPRLNNPQLKFQLANPSVSFMKMIDQKIQPEQIISLQLQFPHQTDFEFFSIFREVICMSLVNFPYENQIDQYKICFPNLICLSFYYDNEINFHRFHHIFDQLWNGIQRLEIHTTGIPCIHYGISPFENCYKMNMGIEYFLFDVGHFSLISMNNCFEHSQSCFSMTLIDFIKTMRNIRCVCLMINRNDVEKFFDLELWEDLIMICSKLKKIKIEILGTINSENDEQLTSNALNIQTCLQNLRQTIKFQIHFW